MAWIQGYKWNSTILKQEQVIGSLAVTSLKPKNVFCPRFSQLSEYFSHHLKPSVETWHYSCLLQNVEPKKACAHEYNYVVNFFAGRIGSLTT